MPRHLPSISSIIVSCLLRLGLMTPAYAQNLPADLQANEYQDPPPNSAGPTSITGMHGCDGPHLMSGIHVGNNLLLCLGNPASLANDVKRRTDYGNVTTINLDGGGILGMHTCNLTQNQNSGGNGPEAMKGIHVGSNILLCVPIPIDLATLHGDTTTAPVRGGMHACPPGEVMVGIHVDRNVLACARPQQ
jgi:hypothetical protein